MASITPRRNRSGEDVWRVQFRVNGRMKQETFPDYKAASRFGDFVDRVGGERAREVLEVRQESVTPSLREYTDTYLDDASGLLNGITDGTRAGYVRMAKLSFLRHEIAELPLDAITATDVAKYIAWQEAQPLARGNGTVAAKTVKNYHSLLSAILKTAEAAGIIRGNPAHGAKIKRGIETEMVCLTPAEYRVLLHYVPDYYKPLVETLAATGMRWGEATALTYADLNTAVSPATLSITKAWKKGAHDDVVLGPPKTRKGRRTVAIPDKIRDMIADSAAPKSQLIFHGRQRGGRIWRQMFQNRVWQPALTKANDEATCKQDSLTPIGKRPRVHDLRHSHASWLINSAVPLPVIQQRLGHEKITTTVGTYGHLMPDAQVQVVAAVDRLMLDA